MNGPAARHPLFWAAFRRTGLSLQQLWLRYLALGGVGDIFDMEAYLHGLGPLSAENQDVLAHTLNERLDELYRADRVPYLGSPGTDLESADPLAVLEELLRHGHRGDVEPPDPPP